MKKIYLLLFFALTVSVSFAQVKSSRFVSTNVKSSKSNVITNNDLSLQETVTQVVATVCNEDNLTITSFASVKDAVQALRNSIEQARSNAPQAAPLVGYVRPDGTLFQGLYRNYFATTATYLYAPAQVTLDFLPYSNPSGASFSWVLPAPSGDIPEADATDANGVLHWFNEILPTTYGYYMPKVTATNADGSSSYQLGQGAAAQSLFAGNVQKGAARKDGTSWGDAPEYPPLTLANLRANLIDGGTTGNMYNGFTINQQSVQFSPKFVDATYGPCTGFMQILPKLVSPLYARNVSVCAYSANGATAVPEGGVLKIQFYYLNDDGSLGELIDESTTNKFYVTSTSGTQGVFVFTFEKEEDGLTIDNGLVLGTKAQVAIVISGFDNTWDFSLLFGTNSSAPAGYTVSLPGSSYSINGDHLVAIGTLTSGSPRADFYIEFTGIFNCLSVYEGTSSVVFPVSGGWGVTATDDTHQYNDIDLYSSYDIVGDSVWVASMPDWVTDYEFDNTYFASDNVLMLYCKADALPSGVTGRSGEVVVASFGVTATIPVTQGDVTGIPSTKVELTTVSLNGNDFVLRYPASATSVSVYNVAGQKVASYPLTAAGTFTVPAANYSKGVYLFNFTGANGVSTVKALK